MAEPRPAAAYIGTSGWMHAHWRGTFYPWRLPLRERLAYYAARFRSVEIEGGFHRFPARRQLAAWSRAVPEDFVFAVKASGRMTWRQRLAVSASAPAALLRSVEPLAGRLGPILFQLPPGWPCNAARLAAFLAALSRDFRYAFEFLDPSWWNAEVYELLARRGAAFCVYEAGGVRSPMEITADFVYVRLHVADAARCGAGTLDDWAAALARWAAQGRAVFCYVQNGGLGRAGCNAAELAARLAAAVVTPDNAVPDASSRFAEPCGTRTR